MKKIIISTAVIGLLSFAPLAFAQSTVTGTLSSGGTTPANSTSLSGSVGSGNSLTGTVTSPSTGGGGNGPPVGGGGGGGGSDTTIICPNLPNSLYTLPAGYEIVSGNCDPIGTVVTPGVPNTGVTVPGIPNTGAGGNAEENDLVLLASGLLGTFASVALLRKYFIRQ
jgi:hypothetical protein